MTLYLYVVSVQHSVESVEVEPFCGGHACFFVHVVHGGVRLAVLGYTQVGVFRVHVWSVPCRLLGVHVRPVCSPLFISFISLKSGVGSQLWLIGLGMPLPSLEAHGFVVILCKRFEIACQIAVTNIYSQPIISVPQV